MSLQFDEEVTVVLPKIPLISHGRPIFILGADVLRHQGGQLGWIFHSMGPGKLRDQRCTQGWMKFTKGTKVKDVPLISAPVKGQTYVRPADTELLHSSMARHPDKLKIPPTYLHMIVELPALESGYEVDDSCTSETTTFKCSEVADWGENW